jgi:hypothetical protein
MVKNQPYYTQKHEQNFHATTTMKKKIKKWRIIFSLSERMNVNNNKGRIANFKYSIIIFKLNFFAKV